MSPSISVVIITADNKALKVITGLLASLDEVMVSGTAEGLQAGWDMVARTRPMLVMLDIDADPVKAFETMSAMLAQNPMLVVFVISSDRSSDTILKAMHQGATEYLLKPLDDKEVVAALTKVGRIMVHRAPEPAHEDGRVITCFSPKGGMGNTTVATNLAVCLHQYTEKPVVLVDLDLESGDSCIFLNMKTKYTITDVTANVARLDRAFLHSVLARHSSGIYLLAEPDAVEEADSITPNQVREVLGYLKTMFPYVVVDTKDGYSDKNIAAMDTSDCIFLTGVLNLPVIKNLQKALDVFEKLGYGKDKVKLLINRYIKKGEISLDDCERALNYKVFWHIPNDFHESMMAINRGTPLAILAQHSDISQSIAGLAREALACIGTGTKRF